MCAPRRPRPRSSSATCRSTAPRSRPRPRCRRYRDRDLRRRAASAHGARTLVPRRPRGRAGRRAAGDGRARRLGRIGRGARGRLAPLGQQCVRRVDQRDVARAQVHDIFVLAPEERPGLAVLGQIGLEDQHAGHDPAGDEREIGAVAAIGDFLRDRARRPRRTKCPIPDGCRGGSRARGTRRVPSTSVGKGLVQRIVDQAEPGSPRRCRPSRPR